MTRVPMSAVMARGLLVGAGLAVLSGCSAGVATEAPIPEPLASSATSPAPGAPPTSQPSPASSAPAAATAGQPPRASSGALDSATVPAPSDLGPGWVSRVEGEDAEEGPGNGTPYQERDPAEIVQTTIPLGCAKRSSSPVPVNVLQATYTHPGTGSYAVVLRMRFESAARARRFVDVRHRDLAACRRQPDDRYSGAAAPVRAMDSVAGRTTATYRLLGEKVPWHTGAQVQGRDVVTLDTNPQPVSLVAWQALGFLAPHDGPR